MEPSFKNDQGSLWLFPDRLVYKSTDYELHQFNKQEISNVYFQITTSSSAIFWYIYINSIYIFQHSDKSDILCIFNLISDWILDDTLQPILPTLEG